MDEAGSSSSASDVSVVSHPEDALDIDDSDSRSAVDTESLAHDIEEVEVKEEEEELIFVQPVLHRYIKHFKMTGDTYKVKVRQFNGDTADALQYFGERLDEVSEKVLENIPGDDHISLQIGWESLEGKVFLNWSKRSEFDIKRVLEIIGSVIQSNKSITLDEPMEIEVNTVEGQSGSGRTASLAHRTDLNTRSFSAMKRGIISIINDDNTCLGRALAVGIARHRWKNGEISQSVYKYLCKKGRPVQLHEARDLYEKAGVSYQQPCGLSELEKFQESLPDYQIVVKTKANHSGHDTFFEGPLKERKIHLLLVNNHYDVITSLTAFYDTPYMCDTCKKPYSRKDQHKCFNPCGACKSFGCATSEWTLCDDCNRMFRSKSCFDKHKMGRVCTMYKRCRNCEVSYKVFLNDSGVDVHRCGYSWCATCKRVRPVQHLCFIPIDVPRESVETGPEQPGVEVKESARVRFIFYDFEARQDHELDADRHGLRYKHIVNYACVQEECAPLDMGSKSCGGPSSCDECEEHVFLGDSALRDFCQYLIQQSGAIGIAHNSGAYDAQFIVDLLLSEGIRTPDVIYRGRKIVCASIPCGDKKIKLIDSLNFVLAPLASFPKMFGLSELTKGYFPHFFNKASNWEYDGPMPPAYTYGPNTMKDSAREAFEVWYEQRKGDRFVMQEELAKYCRSDVQILREGMMRFRDLWMKHGGVDPLRECVTIASASMLVFRRNYLESDTIGIIPKGGYTHKQNQSRSALTWLKWLALSSGRSIQHAGNGPEHKVGRYFVDGYHASSKTAITARSKLSI